MEIVGYAIVLIAGLLCAWFYGRTPRLLRPQSKPESVDDSLRRGDASPRRSDDSLRRGNDRPWRILGAGICVVVAVMFVVGVAAVDIPQRPRAYAAYWLVILFLLLWLCCLAIKDVLYTRRLLGEWQRKRKLHGPNWRVPSDHDTETNR